jgi:ParB-like chromosome segregation protein Spo0J
MKKPFQSTPLQVEITDIDLNPGPFCMSFNFNLGPLKASIERFGILNPPYLLRNSDPSFGVVAGYRRLLALRELCWSDTVCQILPDDFPRFEALLLNLYDNLVNRHLNSVEKGMVLNRLTRFLPKEEIVTDFMPILGIPSNRQTLEQFLGLEELEKPIRVSVATERVSQRVAGLMRNLEGNDRLKINELFVELKLSFNQQWEVIQWIVEIASREGRAAKEILEDDALKQILNDSIMSNPIKSKTIVKILRERRFPSLVKAENAFKKGVSRLSLPQGVKIIPPRFFEDRNYRLEIGFSQGNDLKEKVEGLCRLPGLEHITDFWKGTD